MPSSRVTIEDIPESPIRTLAPLPWDAEALIDTDNPLIPTALTAGSIGSPHHVGEPDSMLDSSTSDMAVDVPSFLRSAFHEEEEEAEPSLPIHFSNSDVAMDTDDVSPLLGIFHEEEEEEQSHPTPSSTTLAVRHALFPTEAEEEEEEEVEVGPRRHPDHFSGNYNTAGSFHDGRLSLPFTGHSSMQSSVPVISPIPVKFSNDVCDDFRDGQDFVSTYLLNVWFR
ncbi:hypothetical protein B0H11DRAFT_2194142, partial [Mycena galericulata]